MGFLPTTVMEKLIKKAGATRVSESAKIALLSSIQTKAEEISQKAILFSQHAGRKTVKKEDIELVD